MGRGRWIFIGLSVALSISVSAQLTLTADYRKADSVAHANYGHALTDIRSLVQKLTMPFTSDKEKFRAIYTWVCLNVEQDYAMFQRNKRQREKLNEVQLKKWNARLNQQMFARLLLNKRTVCSGYAYLIRAMAAHAGLTCVLVDGYGRTPQSNAWKLEAPNHTWNAVKLDDQWYLCDATWSSGSIQGEGYSFLKQYDDAYFLSDPTMFSRNHYPLDTTWLLLRHKPSLQNFVGGPIIYKGFLRYNIKLHTPRELTINVPKGVPIDIQFTAEASSLPVFLQVHASNSIVVAKPIYEDECDVYTLQYQFAQVGNYTAHVLINTEIVMSYHIKVTNSRAIPNAQSVVLNK